MPPCFAVAVWHTPTVAVVPLFEHWTLLSPLPQQSESFRQMSPSTRQPCAGWQMKVPVGPYGAQSRLQQLPQLPASPVCGHSWPSSPLQLTPPDVGWVQRPGFVAVTAWPFGAVQRPPQQSSGR
jgi:hypothetical protein